MERLAIETLPVKCLREYENNARSHGDTDVSAIMESIKEFGFNDPIGVWGKDNTIVEGHGRLMAARLMGIDAVPVIHLDHLSDEQRRAYALAHNKIAELSEWDFNVLGGELGEIGTIDMASFGFCDEISDEDFGTEFELPSGDKEDSNHMTFTLHREQMELVESVLQMVTVEECQENKDEKGNAIYEVCKEWEELKKLN